MSMRIVVGFLVSVSMLTGCGGTQAEGGNNPESSQGVRGSLGESAESPSALSESASPSRSPSTTSYLDVLDSDKITTASLCMEYENRITEFQSDAKKRMTSAKGKYKDAYAAASFRKNNSWVKEAFDETFQQAISEAGTSALSELSDGTSRFRR